MSNRLHRPMSQELFDTNWDQQILKDLKLDNNSSTDSGDEDIFKGINNKDSISFVFDKTVDVIETKVVRLLLIKLKHEPYFPEFIEILERSVERIAATHCDQMEIQLTLMYNIDEPSTVFITVPVIRSPISPRFVLYTSEISRISLQQTLLPVFNWMTGIMATRRQFNDNHQYFMLHITLWNPSRNAMLQLKRPLRDGYEFYIKDLSIKKEKRTRIKVEIIENSFFESCIRKIIAIIENFFPFDKRNGHEQYSLSAPDYPLSPIRQFISNETASYIRNWILTQRDYQLDRYGLLQIYFIDLNSCEIISYVTT